MIKKALFLIAALFLAITGYAAPKSIYEKNRLELINPMKAGELMLRPTFMSCSFYYGTDKVSDPVLQYKKAGEKNWRKALTPVHFFENENTTTGLVMNEYRGSIVKLEENTTYEVRFCDGKKVLANGKFTTWNSVVPIAKTVYIDPSNVEFPILISAKGTPDGWICYTVKNGKTLKGKEGKPVFIIKDAEYVILKDMTIVGGKNSQNAIKLEKSKAVRICNCDISGWGRLGELKFDIAPPRLRGVFYFKNAKGQYRAINYDGAIDIAPGNKEIVVERCYVHDPVSRSNSWYYCHPAGPQAIVCTKPDHSTVIRYNDFIGSDLHRFNDAVEGPGNFHSNGGINRDADVYGNYMIFCNDDCIELDGGQQNIRCFWNHFEGALCGVSIQGCMTSPVYVFENIFNDIRAEFNELNVSIKTSGKTGIKPVSFIFNNTFGGRGSAFRFNKNLKSIVRNNVAIEGQNFGSFEHMNDSLLSSNSAIVTEKDIDGIEKFNSVLKNAPQGNYYPVNVQKAEHIDNFCEGDNVRGALQKDSNALPYRPIPVVLDRTRIGEVKVNNGTAVPSQVKITATVGGKNFKANYKIRKNNVFDWFEVTPSAGTLKSGDKITFTVKFNPEKMAERQFYRGAFSLRLDSGFSRVVSIYAETDFAQPFRLEKEGEKAFYIDAFTPSFVSYKGKPRKADIKKDKMGKDGKVAVISANSVYEYTFDVPEAGRYYFLIRGYNKIGRVPKLKVSVNGSKNDISNQQVVKDRMRWTILTPGFRGNFRVQYFDLKEGKCTLRLEGTGHPLLFDGIVMASNPGSFEPK